MDLKDYIQNKIWILHQIDAATRYSVACLDSTKHQDKIIRKVYLIWISYFGTPIKFLSDNGGEFSNDSYSEMNEKLNVESATTASDSLLVERQHKGLNDFMMKTLEGITCESDVALAWSARAKNALQMAFALIMDSHLTNWCLGTI